MANDEERKRPTSTGPLNIRSRDACNWLFSVGGLKSRVYEVPFMYSQSIAILAHLSEDSENWFPLFPFDKYIVNASACPFLPI